MTTQIFMKLRGGAPAVIPVRGQNLGRTYTDWGNVLRKLTGQPLPAVPAPPPPPQAAPQPAALPTGTTYAPPAFGPTLYRPTTGHGADAMPTGVDPPPRPAGPEDGIARRPRPSPPREPRASPVP